MRLLAPAIGLLAVFLASCASSPPVESRKGLVASAKSVAIVTAVGRQVELQYIGFTIFNNIVKPADISTWGLDKKIQDAARQLLPKGVELRTVEYAPELEQIHYAPAADRGLRADLGDQVLLPYINRLTQRTPVDLILFILPRGGPRSLIISNGHMAGSFGFVQAHIAVVLMDARTKQEIFGKASLPPCTGGVTKFDYESRDMANTLEQHRTELERLWMTCISKKLEVFNSSSGI